MSNVSSIRSQIEYYCRLKNPAYAVMVTGAWGVGKTYQVKEAMGPFRPHYISLYGVTNASEIYEAAFAKMFPARQFTRRGAEKLRSVSIDAALIKVPVGEILGAVTNAIIKQNISAAHPIIFDDLERCSMKINDVMGVLNDFVEHHKCNVVLIVHDSEMEDEFKRTKEKIVGNTLLVIPQIESAIDLFLVEAKDVFAFMDEYKYPILTVFKESGVESLRVLRQIVQDCARLLSKIDDKFMVEKPKVFEIVKFFCAINIFYKSGKISANNNFDDLVKKYYLSKVAKDKKDDEFEQMFDNIKSVNFMNEIFTGDAIIDTVITSRYDNEVINGCLSNIVLFREEVAVPDWKIIYSFDSLDDHLVLSALLSLKNSLKKRLVTESGEILHCYAALMMMSTKGVVKSSIGSLAEEAKKYIRRLAKEGTLLPRETSWDWRSKFDRSWMGNGYWVEDEKYGKDFYEVKDFLVKTREDLFEKSKFEIAKKALCYMNESESKFYSFISFTGSGGNEFTHIPFLHLIPVKKFLNVWMESPKSNWHMIAAGLKSRYDADLINRELEPEKNWRFELQAEVAKLATRSSGVSKGRLERLFKQMELIKE